MTAEIWLGGMKNEAYRMENVKHFETSIDGAFCRMIDEKGNVLETSPHNVVLISVAKQPTADVVKVVRCGQCGNYCKNTGECNLYGRHPNENDFCSSGVLKE